MAGRRLSIANPRGGGGGRLRGEAALLDKNDPPESRIEVDADAIPVSALTGGLVCTSCEMCVSAGDRMVEESIVDPVR
jgi:hypothetical protein